MTPKWSCRHGSQKSLNRVFICTAKELRVLMAAKAVEAVDVTNHEAAEVVAFSKSKFSYSNEKNHHHSRAADEPI